MASITTELSQPVYRDLQDYAKRVARDEADLIREAVELYHDQKIQPRRLNLSEMPSFSVNKILKPLGPGDELLGEMLEGSIE